MKLHIFNPEHDIALACDDRYFTPPHAGRELRSDLGFIPSLWADDGDFVLVDDIDAALERIRHVKGLAHDVVFVTKKDIGELVGNASDRERPLDIVPWGWDSALCHSLKRAGVPEECLPSESKLAEIRNMSGRIWANVLRSKLPVYNKGVISMPMEHTSVDDFQRCYDNVYGHCAVVKAPWSSSGRGVRYFTGELTTHHIGWVRNIIRQQGAVVSETYYNKYKDLAVEFYAHEDGSVTYEGLSLFKTVNGAYAGNILVDDATKWEMVAKYGVADDLHETIDIMVKCLPYCFRGAYTGPFGVDMMVLADGTLHPCVELNLRRTMGHVALAISPDATGPQRLMRIDYDGHYRLRIIDTFENVINNSLV